MINHFYQDIYGWFSYEHIYKGIVEQLDDNSLIVEIGSFKGKSAAFMAVEIANSGKKIKFDCVDPMKLLGHYADSAKEHPEVYEGYDAASFHQRLITVRGYYNLHAMTSDDAVNLYEDKSIDFLMIDGDHSYEAVKKDVINWIPKIRPGGLIMGDDAYVSEIQRAAQEGAALYGLTSQLLEGLHFCIEIPDVA